MSLTTEQSILPTLQRKFCLSCGQSRPVNEVKNPPGTPVNVGVCKRCVLALCRQFGLQLLSPTVRVLHRLPSGRWPKKPSGCRAVLYIDESVKE